MDNDIIGTYMVHIWYHTEVPIFILGDKSKGLHLIITSKNEADIW